MPEWNEERAHTHTHTAWGCKSQQASELHKKILTWVGEGGWGELLCVCEEELWGYRIAPRRQRWQEMLNIGKCSWAEFGVSVCQAVPIRDDGDKCTCAIVSVRVCVCCDVAVWCCYNAPRVYGGGGGGGSVFKGKYLFIAAVSFDSYLSTPPHTDVRAHVPGADVSPSLISQGYCPRRSERKAHTLAFNTSLSNFTWIDANNLHSLARNSEMNMNEGSKHDRLKSIQQRGQQFGQFCGLAIEFNVLLSQHFTHSEHRKKIKRYDWLIVLLQLGHARVPNQYSNIIFLWFF